MPRPKDKVGKYEIVERIARGGMGAVYKAKHPTLKRFVILKQLTLRTGTGIIGRFKREASLMIDFRDERIVPVYDHFRHGSSYYIVMEYVDGTSLDRLIEQRNRLSCEAALLIFSEICRGLKYAHDKGVVHRDIKPGNVLISWEGEVKLTDFGIATTMGEEDDGLTQAGMTLGTPAYMSPEQISDTKNVDKRADIYSMGVMLYEMLTGKKPFPTSFTPATIDLINRGIYVNPGKINPDIPLVFRRLIRRMMNRRVKKRCRDLDEVTHILSRYSSRFGSETERRGGIRKYLEGKDIAAPQCFGLRTIGSRFPLIPAVVLASLIVLAGGGFYWYYSGLYFDLFKSRTYGKVAVSVRVEGHGGKRRYLYARARFISQRELPMRNNVENKITYDYLLRPGTRFFPLSRSKEDGPVLLSLRPRFLPAGDYHLELTAADRIHYRVFHLNAREQQRSSAEEEKGLVLEFNLPASEPRTIQLTHTVTDSATGKDILDTTSITFYEDDTDQWLDWKYYSTRERLRPYFRSLTKSGREYFFKYKAPGYYEETIRFYVPAELDTVETAVALIKKPGVLVLSSNHPGLDILIDGSEGTCSGDKGNPFIEFGKTGEEPKTFSLKEGTHVLTVVKSGRLKSEYEFKIIPQEKLTLHVTYDAESRDILILPR